MNNSRTKNAKRNIITGFINRIVMLLFPFVIRTVLIKKLGAEYLGLNSLFSSILQVLNLAELGFGSAVVYSMYKPLAENDGETIRALMNLYKKMYRIIGFIILVVGSCLMPFLKYLIKGSYPSDINIYVVFLLHLINTSFTYFLFAYKSSILIANQRSDITNNVLTIMSIMQYVLQIIVLYATKNYYFYMMANLVTTALNNLIVNYYANKEFPQFYCSGEVNDELKKDIKKKVVGLLINKVCQTTRNSLDSIFISAFLGLKMVAMYNNYYTIMNAVIGIMGVVGSSITAGIGNSIVIETKEKNYKDLKKFNFIYMLFSGLATVCMLNLYQPFMKLWLGQDMLLPFGVVVLFCIYFFSLKMGDIRAVYSDAKGLWWENRYRAVAESMANIILNFILGKIWGIYGIIVATLISLLIINFGYGSQILFKYYFTNVSVLDYFRQQLWYAFVTIIACLITYYLNSFIKTEGILGLLIKLIISVAISLLVYFVFYFKNENYKEAKRFLKKLINR